MQGYPSPGPPPQARPRRWFFRQTRPAQVLLGCGVVVVALGLCGTCTLIATAGLPAAPVSTATPTATGAPVAVVTTTHAPTHVVATRLPSP
ncbi:MAG: hypothetical protein H0W02_19705, partial [Ktedonobacteraceae bacterium]|nr:hypothetical protein [Ktedonobacteraceae bacterium]